MKRSTVLLLALLCACTVGEVPGGDGGNKGDAGAGLSVCVARVASPPAPHNHSTAPLGPRARSSCMDATTCHGSGGAGGQFAMAGTVYQETAAATALGGVTVRIFKSGDKMATATAVTDTAGNFYFPAGMLTAFPYQTDVTSCDLSTSVKGIRPMVGPIGNPESNCNTSGSCHGEAGTQGAIYLSP
jgi:hypothetical protein